jgi:hypothetical protein
MVFLIFFLYFFLLLLSLIKHGKILFDVKRWVARANHVDVYGKAARMTLSYG